MIVLVDATTLALLVNPDATPPIDPATKAPLTSPKARLERLVAQIDSASGAIIIPTPVLAEVLVRVEDAAPEILERLNKSARFRIADFDQRAAIELAAMTREAMRRTDKFDGSQSPWQKVKLDRQIIAIARVHGAEAIYSDDEGIAKFAQKIDLPVVRTWELPLPEAPPADLFTTAPRWLAEANPEQVDPKASGEAQ